MPIPRQRIFISLTVVVGAAVIAAFPLRHEFRKNHEPNNSTTVAKAPLADDISRLNATAIHEAWDVPNDESTAQSALRELLKQAGSAGMHVSVAGARHSMGGQTIAPGGVRVNMLPLKSMSLDEKTDVLHVDAGALWANVIPYLDRRGRSIEVMQSDNSFTVGGSLSVNCHGWQYGRPPIASTVESFYLMKADGTVVRCSRTENKELFSLALGGYGLFGIILDADLHVVRNERLRLEQVIVPLDSAMASFERKLRERGTPRMFYARLNITRDRMFDDVLINMFYPEQGEIPNLTDPKLLRLRRAIFRGSVGSAFGKEARWEAETRIAPHLTGTVFSRNQLMDESADWYLDHSDATTDILHEYFLPRDGAVPFLRQARTIIRAHRADLLNVTVREVQTDGDTFLRYADQPMIAFVMFFSQRRTASADRDMEQMTRELIDAALHSGGRYYLPYRLHASADQFRAAYPRRDEFFLLKRKYDPTNMFENEFYLKYANP
ncbi:MAG: FAD-binding oxidoreductase [Candidatus Sulfotelmatobacter sp.]